MSDKETIDLVLVSYIPSTRTLADGAKSEVWVRTLRYEKRGTMLFSLYDVAPIGAKRLKLSDLPRVGGNFGVSVIAATYKEAREQLLLALTARRDKALQEAGDCVRGLGKLSDAADVTPLPWKEEGDSLSANTMVIS